MIYAVSILIKLLISKRIFAVNKMGVNEVVDTSWNLLEDANLDLNDLNGLVEEDMPELTDAELVTISTRNLNLRFTTYR